MEEINLLGIITSIIGVGIVVLIPHFLFFQIVWKELIRPHKIIARRMFLLGVVVCTISIPIISHAYKSGIDEMETFENSNYSVLNNSYFTERILGMHFIYHTRICIYDGWRPPKHDPALVIGMWLNQRKDPLDIPLKKRLKLYQKFFPENKVKYECSCAIEYSIDYHNDELWKVDKEPIP